MRLLQFFLGGMFLASAMSVFAAADAERGKALTLVCTACHGKDGNSVVGTYPNIAGQNEQYLLKQMLDIKSKARSAPLMAGILDNLDEQQLENIAAYYSEQKLSSGSVDPKLVELGETIYRSGIKRKEIAACSACHAPDGSGNGPAAFPVLSGQWPEYTVAQLKAFRSGERHNDGDARMMRITSMDLSDHEIEAVASYLFGLH